MMGTSSSSCRAVPCGASASVWLRRFFPENFFIQRLMVRMVMVAHHFGLPRRYNITVICPFSCSACWMDWILFSMEGVWCNTPMEISVSNAALRNGRFSASPYTKWICSSLPNSRAPCRAACRELKDISNPTMRACFCAARLHITPCPQPTSRHLLF